MSTNWYRPPMEIVQAYEQRKPNRGEIGALIVWASWTVEGLLYLDRIDAEHFDHGPRDQSAAIINMTHVRWASGTAITALDLCAAALAREYCGWTRGNEYDLRDFRQAPKTAKDRAALPASAITWVDAVLGDTRYKEVHGTRDPMTHSRLRRDLTGGDPRGMKFKIDATGSLLTTREIVIHARDLATQRVDEFLKLVDSLP